MLKYPLLFYHCISYCLAFTLLFSIHIFYLALFCITRACEQQTFSGNTSAVRRLILHQTSGSFVFATEDGCWSAQTCIANLELCVLLQRNVYLCLTSPSPPPITPPNPPFSFVPFPPCKTRFYSAPLSSHRTTTSMLTS